MAKLILVNYLYDYICSNCGYCYTSPNMIYTPNANECPNCHSTMINPYVKGFIINSKGESK